MNTAELKLRIDALSAEIERVDNRINWFGNIVSGLEEGLARLRKNMEVDIYELRQRIRALETGR